MSNINEISISAHGYERLLERTQCKQSKVMSFLENVWENGKTLKSYDRKSSMFRYLKNTIPVGGEDRVGRVKGNTLFIYNKDENNVITFITCFEIPQKVIQDRKKKH